MLPSWLIEAIVRFRSFIRIWSPSFWRIRKGGYQQTHNLSKQKYFLPWCRKASSQQSWKRCLFVYFFLKSIVSLEICVLSYGHETWYKNKRQTYMNYFCRTKPDHSERRTTTGKRTESGDTLWLLTTWLTCSRDSRAQGTWGRRQACAKRTIRVRHVNYQGKKKRLGLTFLNVGLICQHVLKTCWQISCSTELSGYIEKQSQAEKKSLGYILFGIR